MVIAIHFDIFGINNCRLYIYLNGFLCFHKWRAEMSDYNWCHGPKCHTKHTQDRIRGVKGSKVLRTRKIP